MKRFIYIILLTISINTYCNTELNNKNIESIDIEIKEDTQNKREEIINYAKTLLGYKYKWGHSGPDLFDCSGYIYHIFKKNLDIVLPRVSRDMSIFKEKKKIEDLIPGDLVFFITSGKKINHVGIYLGNNEFIHASSAKKKVIISNMGSGFYFKNFQWGINPY